MLSGGIRVSFVLMLCALLNGAALAQNYSEVATNTGYRDGLEKGRNDARQGKSFNLERHDAHRDADHGYRDRFGNKQEYRQLYREAFRRGYEEGYRGQRGRWPERESVRDDVLHERPRTAYVEVAQNTGYRDGLGKGRDDAREGNSFNVERHDAYRDADHGYRDSFGNKTGYREQYREAFRRGYQEGYRADRGRRPSDRLDRRDDAYFGQGQPATGYADVARNTGYRDGQEKGRNDARQGKSYNLERHDAWKDADHGYRSSVGNKEGYRQEYREAFRRGYEDGYRRGR